MRDILGVPPAKWRQDEEISIFSDAVGQFFERECKPHVEAWRKQGYVPQEMWKKAGEAGLLCASIPEEYGGAGGDFRHEAVIIEQQQWKGIDGFGITLHNAIIAPYIEAFGSEEQKKKWLPRLASGELIAAIAMTEPGTGSDLQAVKTTAKKDGNHYVINGSKTFISNGQTANLIVTVAKTDPSLGAKGISLIVVETDEVEGFERGRNLEKIGQKAADTSELFFNDVRVPTSNLLGAEEGQGFVQLMTKLPQERHVIGLQGVGMIERAIAETTAYVKQRKAFGGTIWDFQNTQFKLAECKTEATVAKVFADHCTELLLENKLDAATASMSKYWISDLQCKIIDECLQLHGGYGYMDEYPIGQMYADARVQRIYGGANEVMKMLIARTM
ncbi:MAG: acyl-CoA dehydrogenase [Henriciella sp.]|jgi:acyl-CoA dehydrogenase|uniref:acyl-CoA dehydrogenase family protein n=1 Tax=Henriciella sp. TaxID=1968823 RepID=UPI000C0EB393|nr:acyl-CoA dehydrogenase family protein [Henriciella sp.]MAN75183.1 acyl-CoA dehydrogenase [Henriciella sp.]MBF33298.1 acyl-CoA dehydrogenase [Hyphomonadaceae bacterium]MBK76384.1 acyl-CoA dehydrogenase [Henriciella sp.]PHR79003.1 MAG: acyl-CoA dehydrogenase [Henriciella sp.]|tara:strand:- start:211 stop:1374 length:1164 start_codon:yes stop_codon:yes gene_type:complete